MKIGPPITPFGRFRPLFPARGPKLPGAPAYIPPLPFPVPPDIAVPHYVPNNFWSQHDSSLSRLKPRKEPKAGKVPLGGPEEHSVREAAKLAALVLREGGKLVKPGIRTSEIDQALHELIVSHGAYPSPLGYSAFPKSICTSINNVIAHGIPDDRPLDEHDLINIDVTVFLNGYHGDNSATFLLPLVDNEGRELTEATREAMEEGIKVCGPGVPYKEIGRAIEDFADSQGFLVCDLFTGHHISTLFHYPPWITHLRNDEPGVMSAGDCFTIEPSLETFWAAENGDVGGGEMWDDGWTVVTKSGARSAQFEHQLLITEDGADVLTR